MPRYLRLGELPRKRHIQFRKPDGGLYSEQLFGTRGFSGPQSLLYHLHPPTEASFFWDLGDARVEPAPEGPLHHRHLKTRTIKSAGDPISGRVPLLTNQDITFSLCLPDAPMEYFYKNADGDDLLFIHLGTGKLETLFGDLPFAAGDYLVLPRGTIYRVVADSGDFRMLVMDSAGPVDVPKRYRNEYGQLLEHAPYLERDVRVPNATPPREERGKFEVRIRARGRLTAYYYEHHPLDVVGWDGCVYPWALNIADFEPITGSLHQPPPVHQTFEGKNFVVCSFVPRRLDYHPQAVPVPYNHSNVDSDEVLYYVNGNFSSRRGIEEGSITHHPAGIPHGPQPGAVEASLGAERTEELAVMLDSFRPLQLTKQALALEDERYPASWLP